MPATTPSNPRIVILGGGYAGLSVAARLGRLDSRASLTLVDAKAEFFERIRLHQVVAGQPQPSWRYVNFLAPRGVNFLQARASGLDPAANLLSLTHPDGRVTTLAYDYLVYALGSHTDRSSVPGVGEFAHTLDSLASAQAIRAQLATRRDPRVLVVGGGLTGIELAAELAESDSSWSVSLASERSFHAEAVPGGFSAQAAAYLWQTFERHHIALQTGSRVAQLGDGVATMRDGCELAFDVCIWSSGFVPPSLAAEAGVEVNARGQIRTDAHLRSLSHPNIIAVGDAAEAKSLDAGPCRMGCATGLAMASAGARTLAALLAGRALPAFRFVYLFRNISLGRNDALIQFVDRRDKPRDVIWTGGLALRWKEYICRSTLSTIGLLAAEKPPATPPLRMWPQLLRAPAQYA